MRRGWLITRPRATSASSRRAVWHCLSLEGSSGTTLLVAPSRFGASGIWSGVKIHGPALEIDFWEGETSGRFAVARGIARYFPQQRPFVDKVVAEGLYPKSDFPAGPYLKDRLLFRNASMVEYETPPFARGLGAAANLAADGLPIRAVDVLEGRGAMLAELAIKLPPNDADLVLPMLRQVFPTVSGLR